MNTVPFAAPRSNLAPGAAAPRPAATAACTTHDAEWVELHAALIRLVDLGHVRALTPPARGGACSGCGLVRATTPAGHPYCVNCTRLAPGPGGAAAARARREREGCRRAVVIVVREAGEATTKQVAGVLRKAHGRGTVVKALADLTRAGRLVNARDRRGYRLAGGRS